MNVSIRKWQISDAAALSMILSDRELLSRLRDGIPYPYTESDAAEYISSVTRADQNDAFVYAVTLDDEVVGCVGAFRGQNIHRQTAELGYYLARSHWGKGIMTCAVMQLCDTVFEQSDILRIFAEPFDFNAASRRVLEKCGFTLEGIMRQNAVKDGKILDMPLYSLTREDHSIKLRPLDIKNRAEALSLVWNTFLKFEAPEYSPAGTAEFRRYIDSPADMDKLLFYEARSNGRLVGVLAMRGHHISLFFVDERFQRRGIGKSLFEHMKNQSGQKLFTVNSSPFAVGFYIELGFKPLSAERTQNGIKFTPMQAEYE